MVVEAIGGVRVAVTAAAELGGRCRQHPGATERGDYSYTRATGGAASPLPALNRKGGPERGRQSPAQLRGGRAELRAAGRRP
jgi:hypothetical protein